MPAPRRKCADDTAKTMACYEGMGRDNWTPDPAFKRLDRRITRAMLREAGLLKGRKPR